MKSIADRIIAYIDKRDEAVTRREIAHDLRLETATVSGRVNKLIKDGILVVGPGKDRCNVTGNLVEVVSLADYPR